MTTTSDSGAAAGSGRPGAGEDGAFAALLAEAVTKQLASDTLWEEVRACMVRQSAVNIGAIETWRIAWDASGLGALEFARVFHRALGEARAAREAGRDVG